MNEFSNTLIKLRNYMHRFFTRYLFPIHQKAILKVSVAAMHYSFVVPVTGCVV